MKKLFTLIRQGKLDEVKKLIEKKGELVNCVSGAIPKSDRGQSPLQVAFKTGNYEIAEYLISHGADVNFMEAEDNDGGLRTPVLFDAINAAIVSLCYEDFSGSETAFGYVKCLIEQRADVNKQASNGQDAIQWAITRAEGILERVSAYPNVQDAARERLTNVLDLLIEHGADYIAWANRSYFPAPYTEPTNKNVFLDECPNAAEAIVDRIENTRTFIREYFNSRGLRV